MAIQTEIWARDIAENIYPDNSFMVKSLSDDGFVSNKTVHLPQSGAAPTVEKNRTVIPAVGTQRTDTIKDYDLGYFTSTPTIITDIEEIETSYPKRQSVLFDHIGEINKTCANDLQFTWSGSNVIRTTGDARIANTPGATGNRKFITIDDFFKAKAMLDDDDIPMSERVVLLPAHFYNDLLQNYKAELLRMDHTGHAGYKDGVLDRLLGFTIHTRGKKNVLRFSNDATPVKIDPQTAGAATDNAAALFWHPNFVRRAKGSIKVFEKIDDPQYYGSLFSAGARLGGSPKYTNGRGTVTLAEAAAA